MESPTELSLYEHTLAWTLYNLIKEWIRKDGGERNETQ